MYFKCFLIAILLSGCVSREFCSKEKYAAEKKRFSYTKCSASVGADVGLATLAVLGAAAAAQGGNNNSSPSTTYDGNCACPADLDSQGNRCGLRSAYSRSGGAEPSCIGRQ